MRSAQVHRFMRRAFIAFLHEHGMVRPMSPAAGIACLNHAGFHIRLGYQLGVGFYDWTGNDLQLIGTITTVGRLKRSLQSNAVQPDDLLSTVLRNELRAMALAKVLEILGTARASGREVPSHLPDVLRVAEADHLYVPDYRYQAENDLRRWCGAVRPRIPDLIQTMKFEAEQLRRDAEAER